jgi:hypothetical protein
METSSIADQEKVQDSTISWKIDAYSFLGFSRAIMGTLSGKKVQQTTVLVTVRCSLKS